MAFIQRENENLYFKEALYGKGSMGDYYNSIVDGSTTAPWKEQRKLMKYVIIEYGVTNVASSSFELQIS